MTCKYKNMFGKPGEGVHSIRLFDIAIIDVAFTFLFAYLLKKLGLDIFKNTSVYIIFAYLMLLSLVIHKIFCVETTLTKFIFD